MMINIKQLYIMCFDIIKEGRLMNNVFGRVLLPVMFFLTISGFGLRANAQVGTNNLFCPHIPVSEGMLNLNITPSATNAPNFTAGMIGTLERINGRVSGGIDWMPTRGGTSSVATSAPTNELGSQLITWWSRKNGRNTTVQITNASDNSGTHTPGGLLNVHVRIFNDECLEIRDFCDQFTAFDTHVYDLGDLTTNTGLDVSGGFPANKEGMLIVTPVDDCDSFSKKAIEHDFLSGNMYMSDSLGYTYGTNMYARQAICTSGCTGILDGSADAMLDNVLPVETYGLFNALTSDAGSDVVIMNFQDSYGPPYRPVPAFSVYTVGIFDAAENLQSCGSANLCFVRLGIGSSLPARQDLGPPITGP
jgi:hypothetical protein